MRGTAIGGNCWMWVVRSRRPFSWSTHRQCEPRFGPYKFRLLAPPGRYRISCSWHNKYKSKRAHSHAIFALQMWAYAHHVFHQHRHSLRINARHRVVSMVFLHHWQLAQLQTPVFLWYKGRNIQGRIRAHVQGNQKGGTHSPTRAFSVAVHYRRQQQMPHMRF